jgi:hypothetical protein
MLYEIKFGLIGFAVGTVAISATTFASNLAEPKSPVISQMQAPAERLALLPSPKPTVLAEKVEASKAPAPAAPMSEWRRAYIAKHGHQPPVPAA